MPFECVAGDQNNAWSRLKSFSQLILIFKKTAFSEKFARNYSTNFISLNKSSWNLKFYILLCTVGQLKVK